MRSFTCLPIFLIIILSGFSAAGQEKKKQDDDRPYKVHEKMSKISRVDIRKDAKGTENIVQIDVQNMSGGVTVMSQKKELPPARITDLIIVRGNYNLTRELNQNARGMSLQLMDVVFPLRVRVTVIDQVCEFEIGEKGFWKVSIGLLQ